MVTAFWTAWILGLLGSLHCLGMCGPLALALPAGPDASRRQRTLTRVHYNLGRAATYALMGLFAGSLGGFLQMAGFQQSVSILLGVLLILTLFLKADHFPKWITQYLYRPLQRKLGERLRAGGHQSFFQIGMLNGLLPCGLVYAALAGASLQENALGGSIYMALFGLGTFPLMFCVSMGGLRLRNPRFRPFFQYLVPTLTLVAGGLLILRGLSLGIPYISPDLAAGSCCPQ